MTALIDVAPGTVDRFATPLYTGSESARYVRVPTSTFQHWTRTDGERVGHGRPLVTTLPRVRPRSAGVPFVGLAEALVLAAVRKQGVPMQRIRPALTVLAEQIGLGHALASRRLYTDGAEIIFDYAQSGGNDEARAAARDLVVVRDGQRVFSEVIEGYLQRVEYGDDDYVNQIRLPAYDVAQVVVDPRRSFGQPIFARGGARIEDAVSLFQAGESLAVVAEETGAPLGHVEDVIRVASTPHR